MTGGRLLRSIDRHGHIVRAAAHRAAAGGATIAARAQVPVSVIAEHGRWRPGSPVVLSCIRAVDRWRDNAMRGVGL